MTLPLYSVSTCLYGWLGYAFMPATNLLVKWLSLNSSPSFLRFWLMDVSSVHSLSGCSPTPRTASSHFLVRFSTLRSLELISKCITRSAQALTPSCRPARTVPRDTGSLSFYTNFAPTTASQKPLANMRIYLVITINHLIVWRCFMSRLAVVPNFEQKE